MLKLMGVLAGMPPRPTSVKGRNRAAKRRSVSGQQGYRPSQGPVLPSAAREASYSLRSRPTVSWRARNYPRTRQGC